MKTLVPLELLKLLTEFNAPATPIFSFAEARVILLSLLTKCQRGNGLGQRLMRELKRRGFCYQQNSHTQDHRPGFMCELRPYGGYTFKVEGHRYHVAQRLLQHHRRHAALEESKLRRQERRHAYAEGAPKPKKKIFRLRSLAGANGRLRQHFKHSAITFKQAITAIAYAARKTQTWVTGTLMTSLDERSVASLRLSGGFVFRVDLPGANLPFVSLEALAVLFSTNDNKHAAYRRLRYKLRRICDKVSKEHRFAQEKFIKRQRFLQRVA